ncbi:Uma2 family endonuclease [Streptomyces zingiberis]|uniref:Uma2 family endonuclease n=1 Tax=Streptomyces zingiberis TaxID=2053010 RepID=A0ABX1BX80_9ACTN|nr:Uma2 family endonuclease [Streptomyces zingiberis]NJQ02265.1 Uma2 family endonuclease [Streptomyces zingiberis]
MTIELTDRIEMADSDELSLDEMFELLEQMPVPEGYRVEIVEGAIQMSPQRDAHWEIIRRIVRTLEDRFGLDVKVKSGVRFDFPGGLNGFAPDVVKLADEARQDGNRRWDHGDIEFVAEIVSRATRENDYVRKKRVHARAGVPVHLIADPYTGKCHAFGRPEGEEYESELTVDFGEKLDLSPLGTDWTLETDRFPRE